MWQVKQYAQAGFAMPMAFALGLCMLAIATTSILLAEDGRNSAVLRRDSAASILVTDSAIAETLTALSSRRNSVLLGKNYDPLDPRTGVNFLGEDGIPNSGDEKSKAVDEWSQQSTYACASALNAKNPDILLSNQLSAVSSYQILAYRYNPELQAGSLIIEGRHQGISTVVNINIAIAPDLSYFPGILVSESMYWQGRNITGENSMLYFSPDFSANTFLDSTASTKEDDRQQYLDAIWSGPEDGFSSDPIEHTLVACDLTFQLSNSATGSSLGKLTSNQSLSGKTEGIREYQADSLTLTDDSEIIVDTTNGPVHLYINGPFSLKNQAKIRNIRSDGKPPQAGDLRLIHTHENNISIALYDTTCIENAFIYAPNVDLHLLTTGDGCPGDSNSNVVGVIWAEDIENSTNSSSSRLYNREDAPDSPGSGINSGLEIPEDLSSLQDAMESMNLPILYQVKGVTSWENIDL